MELEFRILGPLEVADGGRVLELGGSRQRALLAALVVEANRVVSADRLVDVLWGEHAPRSAATGLQVLVSNLRRVLEPDRPARTPPRVLVTRPPGYLLVADPAVLDSASFEARLTEAQRELAGGHPARARAALDEALAHWRGPALAEFAGEDFARAEANRLEELRVVALEERAQADLDLGRHRAAVADLEGLVDDHPLRERLWGLLMTAYYRSGRQADALRAYQHARRHLAEELGIDPGPDLQRLEADVLAQAPSLDWRPPETAPVPAPAAPRRTRPREPGLVGRETERERLQAALDDVAADAGRLVLVAGEPGVGKTTLVDELTRSARETGALVCWGRCHPGEGAPPFWPWTQVVRELAAVVPPEPAPSPEAAAVAQVVPELRTPGPAAGQLAANPAQARFQLCQDLATYILRAAGSRCVVIALDDLHWADPPSIELLLVLASRLADASLLVAGTYRDVEVAGDEHPWAAAMAVLARHAAVERLHLGGLSEAETSALIAAATGSEPDQALARAVHARTDGNPFFLTELLKLLASSGPMGTDAKAALEAPVPLGVRDVVSQRVAQLPPAAKELLTVGAVAGREFDQALLEAATDVPEDEALAAVEQTLARGIIVEVPGAVGRYRFSHALIRETIYASTSGVRRARLHARVARALRQLAAEGEEDVAELAHHFWHAVPVAGARPAFDLALRAAGVARAQLAYERSEEQLRRALQLVPALAAGERAPAELQVLAGLGAQLAATRGQADAEVGTTFARAVELCRQLEGSRDAITALWGFFYSSYVRGELEGASAVARQLAAMAEDSPLGEMALAGRLALGIASFHAGALLEAREHLEASARAADERADPSLAAVFQVDPRAYARCFGALVLALLGEEAQALDVAAAAGAVAAELDQPFTAATVAMFRAWLGFLLDDPGATATSAAEAASLAGRHGYPLLSAVATAFDGWALARTGDPHLGAVRVADGLTPFRGAGTTRPPLFVALEADVACRAGRPEEALALINEALACASPEGPHHYFEAALHQLRAQILLATGPDRAAEAQECLARATAIAASQGARLLERRTAAQTLSRT